MKAHIEANTKWLGKPFQVNAIAGRTEVNCNTGKMLMLCIFITILHELFFLCRVTQMAVKSKLRFFSLEL